MGRRKKRAKEVKSIQNFNRREKLSISSSLFFLNLCLYGLITYSHKKESFNITVYFFIDQQLCCQNSMADQFSWYHIYDGRQVRPHMSESSPTLRTETSEEFNQFTVKYTKNILINIFICLGYCKKYHSLGSHKHQHLLLTVLEAVRLRSRLPHRQVLVSQTMASPLVFTGESGDRALVGSFYKGH